MRHFSTITCSGIKKRQMIQKCLKFGIIDQHNCGNYRIIAFDMWDGYLILGFRKFSDFHVKASRNVISLKKSKGRILHSGNLNIDIQYMLALWM